MKARIYSLILALAMATAGAAFPLAGHTEAAGIATANVDVWDLQYRLHELGYYEQSIDGQFGAATKAAVTRFQLAYGITADGIVGTQTWTKLLRVSLNRNDMDLLAHTIYSEARGESYTGQVAVGAVVLNRVQSGKFPNTVRGVIFQSGAFTSVSDGQFWLTPDATAYRAALDAARGWDPSHGALYYFNPATASSKWIWSRPQLETIGHHIFAK